MEGKKNNEAKGVMRIYPNAPLDFCGIPHGTRLRFIGTEHDGSFVFEYEMPEVDDEKMVDAIRMSLMITMSDGALYPGCDITIDQAFAWLERKKAKTTEFPELRESEDERINKAIFKALSKKDARDVLLAEGVQVSEALAYLEKQKEQPTDAKSERVIKAARRVLNNWLDGTDCPDVSGDFAELEYAIREYDGEEKQKEPHYTKRNTLFDKCVENCDPATMKKVSDEVDEILGKEQKPAEIDVKALLTADRLASAEMTGRLKERSEILENPEKYGLCKPAEWNEEDDQLIGFIFDLLNSLVWRKDWAMDKKECLERLKSLRPQPKQEWSEEEALNRTYEEGFNDGLKYRKPVKRSDEDKKMSNWLIGLVNANTELSFKDKVNLTKWLEHLTIEKELSKNDKRIMDAIMIGYQDKDFRSSQIPTSIGVSKDEVINWLKSLRPQPHWKPSEEQMDALLNTLHPDDPYYNGLKSLYEHLKKLMED